MQAADAIFENEPDGNDDDSDGFEGFEDEHEPSRENVSKIVYTSYECVGDGPDYAPRDRANTITDRWSVTAAHVRKRIQSTKRHTKGALRKKYNDIVTKRQEKERHGQGASQQLPVFGVPLQVAVQRSVLNQGIQLTTVVRHCIDHLEEYVDHEGLYRLSGQKSKVEAIKMAYDNGDDIDLTDYTPDEVAGALKLYLRELPSNALNPIVSEVDMLVCPNEYDIPTRCRLLHELLLAELQPCNYCLLSWLSIHLSHVIAQSSVNKMILANVVIVFAPTLNLSQNILNYFFTYPTEVFKGVELKRYVVPSMDDTKLYHEAELDSMDPAELTWQLIKTEDLLTQLHKDLHTLTETEKASKSELIWSYQRQVTHIKRLLRTRAKTILKRGSRSSASAEVPNAHHEASETVEDWESLQNALQESIEQEVVELAKLETELRGMIEQEKEWADMVRTQIADSQKPEEDVEPATEEDHLTYLQLVAEVEQWQSANDELCSDLASETGRKVRLQARLAVLKRHNGGGS